VIRTSQDQDSFAKVVSQLMKYKPVGENAYTLHDNRVLWVYRRESVSGTS
jgi:hypothetical protein